MELTALSCTNYKAFRERARIELHPLTILLGKNNAGKSTLARLPLQLLHAFSPKADTHLDLQLAHIEYGGVFRDLIHRHVPHGRVGLGAAFTHGGEQLEIETTIQNVVPRLEDEYTVVSSWEARGAVDLRFEWAQTPAMPPVYRCHGRCPGRCPGRCDEHDDGHGDSQPRFVGLWPEGLDDGPSSLKPWQTRIAELERHISYLGPIRAPIPRLCRIERTASLGWRGEGAPRMLAAEDALLAAVARWYEEHLEGWQVALDHAGSAFSVLLRRGRTRVNMADAGHGMSQVLPVVVQQCAMALSQAAAPGLCIVEQPELHLHPGAHGALADLFVSNAGRPGTRMLVETHSENFLLRLRRRIAERRLDRAQVALYWIDELPEGESRIKRLEILQSGEIPDWPAPVFSEGYHDVTAMRRAARAGASAREA